MPKRKCRYLPGLRECPYTNVSGMSKALSAESKSRHRSTDLRHADSAPTLIGQNLFRHRRRRWPQLGKVGLQHILLEHPLGIEIGTVDRNGGPHTAVTATSATVAPISRKTPAASVNPLHTEDSVKLTKLRFSHGLGTRLDVLQARQVLDTANTEIPDLERHIGQTECAISILFRILLANPFSWSPRPPHKRAKVTSRRRPSVRVGSLGLPVRDLPRITKPRTQ